MKKTLLTLLVLSGLAFAALEQEDLKVLHNEAVTLDKALQHVAQMNLATTTNLALCSTGIQARELIVLTGTAGGDGNPSSIWYSVSNKNTLITLSDSTLDAAGYENVGVRCLTGDGTYKNLAGEEVVLGEKQYGMLVELVDGTASVPEKVSLIFHYVPEPATATLSLLAFCGLAARRRRK